MKRRNVESGNTAGKLRRAAKRSKLNDGYSPLNVIINFKFLFIWLLVIILDFISEFRFELLYPLWAFFSNSSETFRYKGMSYLFSYVFITITIDMCCYYIMPIQWLFFASSTYVWLQFTCWYSERGLTLFTIMIWFILIMIETFVRLKEMKNVPFQYEICRPFAAHGVGYPILTFGIECKSYVHYRLRLHRKRIVAKENDFYYSLLKQAIEPPPSISSQTTSNTNDATHQTTTDSSMPIIASTSLNHNDHNEQQSNLNRASIQNGIHDGVSTSSLSLRMMLMANNTISFVHTNNESNSNNKPSLMSNRRNNINSNEPYGRFHRRWLQRLKSWANIINGLIVNIGKQFFHTISRILHFYRMAIIYILCSLSPQVLYKRFSMIFKHQSSMVIHNNKIKMMKSSDCPIANGNHDHLHHLSINGSNDVRKRSMTASDLDKSIKNHHMHHYRSKSTESNSDEDFSNEFLNKPEKSSDQSENMDKVSISSVKRMNSQCINVDSTSDLNLIKSTSKDLNKIQMANGKKSKSNSHHQRNNGSIIGDNTTAMSTIDSNLSHTLELIKTKDDHIWKMEQDNLRLKSDLQTIRQCESDLRKQMETFRNEEKIFRNSIANYQQDIEHLQKKIQNYLQAKQQDRQTIQKLEKQLDDEKKRSKQSIEMQTVSEKKAKQVEENAARQIAMATAAAAAAANTRSSTMGCSDNCRVKQRDFEIELANLRKELSAKDEQLRRKELLIEEYKNNGDRLVSALTIIHDQNAQLETSLKLEKVIRAEIFATLEEAKRQMHKQRLMCLDYEKENHDLKTKLFLNSSSLSSLTSNVNGSGISLNPLNGFHSSSSSSSSPSTTATTTSDLELVNRCFSRCSPNSTSATTATGSTATPPLNHSQISLPFCGNISPSNSNNNNKNGGNSNYNRMNRITSPPLPTHNLHDAFAVSAPTLENGWPTHHHSHSSPSPHLPSNSTTTVSTTGHMITISNSNTNINNADNLGSTANLSFNSFDF
ncbi:macoilin-1-like [Dermatophagoides pteronyssinus]|uniref:Macoilin n=1 Tax=Dermatophagoides pteronyssinus TaxID=6956 RepID=A0A6P6XSY4_DERPT|nr:macoilin-2-like [Dermatophagoides pteronyssinus]